MTDTTSTAEESLLRALLDHSQLNSSLSELRASQKLDAVLQNVLSKEIPQLVRDRVHIARQLYRMASGNASLVQSVLESDPTIDTLATIAETKYSTLRKAGHKEVARNLFEAHPTHVLLGMIQRTELPVTTALVTELTPDSVTEVLSYVVHDLCFDMTKSSILFALEQVPPEIQVRHRRVWSSLQEYLATLQRLLMLVDFPEDIESLLQAGFVSANMIKNTSYSNFAAALSHSGALVGDGGRIYKQAVLIDARNDQICVDLQQSNNPDGLSWSNSSVGAAAAESVDAPAEEAREENHEESDDSDYFEDVPSNTLLSTVQMASLKGSSVSEVKAKRTRPAEPLLKQHAAAASVLVETDEVACTDCGSVLSPSAYYVDLLQMLRTSWADPIKGIGKTSLLDKLLLRRPDLAHIQLSCANTNTEMPYIDLANEAMESFLCYLEDSTIPTPTVAHNCEESLEDAGKDDIYVAQNVNLSLYRQQQYIGQRVTPFNVFPLDYSAEMLRITLTASGTSRKELLDVMWSEHRPYTVKDRQSTPQERHKMAQRAYFAEVLGLLECDYMAISKESFADNDKADVSVKSVAQYWGYEGSKGLQQLEKDMVESTSEIRLSLIQKQLLPRAGITFDELLQIQQTRYMDDSVKIPIGDSTAKLDQLELMHAGHLPLTVSDCDRLGSFIRLWQRVGWSVMEIDEAVAILSGVHPGTITGEVLMHLGAVQELSTLTSIDRQLLLPLWGDILPDSRPQSLCRLLFLSDRIRMDTVFAAAVTTGVFPQGATVESHLTAILASLSITMEDLTVIQKVTSSNVKDELSLASLSAYYRIVLVCKIFQVPLKCYSSLEHLFKLPSDEITQSPSSLLQSPTHTLESVRQWNRLLAVGWTSEHLLSLLSKSSVTQSDESEPTPSLSTLNLAMDIFHEGLRITKPEKPDQDENTLKSQADQPAQGLSLDYLLTRLKQDFPEVESHVLEILLTTIVTIPSGQSSQCTAFQQLQSTVKEGISLINSSLTAFYQPSATDEYRFGVIKGSHSASATLVINGTPHPFEEDNASPAGEQFSKAVRLTAGQFYRVEFTGKASDLIVCTRGAVKANIAPETFVSVSLVDSVERVHKALAEVVRVISCYELSASEVVQLHTSKALKYDFTGTPSLQALLELTAYKTLQSSLPPKQDDELALLKMLEWAQGPSPVGDPAVRLADMLQISPDRARSLLVANYPKHSDIERAHEIGQIHKLHRLVSQGELTARAGLGHIDPERLFQSIEPGHNREEEAEWSQSLLAAVNGSNVETAHHLLRETRRTALIHSLLQHEYVRNCEITDADALFDYLLIDVQMGAKRQTSRMAQAISTVQLFVQRCLLSLEYGVSPASINQSSWSWMSTYRVWEANRKVFLYPENWVDPGLRDNKTEPFRELESALMQGRELNAESITQLVKNYIFRTSEIDQLQIQTYLWDRDEADAAEGSFHLFARTPNSPYQYFHRRMSYLSTSGSPVPTWSAWEKIQLEIPTYTTDDRGQALTSAGSYLVPAKWKNQIYLFLPQLEFKSVNNAEKDVSAPDPRNPTPGEKPVGYWELKMAWSIYRNETWSPICTSQASMMIKSLPKVDGTEYPDISSFRFWTREIRDSQKIAYKQNNQVKEKVIPRLNFAIEVERYATPPNEHKPVSIHLGRFEMRGHDLRVVIPKIIEPESGTTLDSSFGKLIPTMGDAAATSTRNYQSGWTFNGDEESLDLAAAPVDWIPAKLKRAVRWTMSYEAYGSSTGYIAEVEPVDAEQARTWMRLPRAAQEGEGGSASNSNGQTFASLDSAISSQLVEAATIWDTTPEIYNIFHELSGLQDPETLSSIFGRFNTPVYRDGGTPFAIYHWELGFHLISLLMERLLAVQQLDLALDIARLVFDPRTPGADGPDESRYWKFPPFKDPNTQQIGTAGSLGLSDDQGKLMAVAILEWRKNPFNAHSVARQRPLVYMKRIAMKYVEILIAAGDMYFRQNSLESIPLALQRYIEASQVFGPAPVKMPRMTKRSPKTYDELRESLNGFSNALSQMELLQPFYVPHQERQSTRGSAALASQSSDTPLGIIKSAYFCVPINPEITKLRDTIDDRLYKVRNCQDINGNAVTLSLFQPSINPGLLVRAAAQRVSPATLLKSLEGPMPNYRFVYLLQKAFELCQEVKSVSNAYLSAKERRDSEALAVLLAQQETISQSLLLDVKDAQLEEAISSVKQLEESRRVPIMRLQYYASLTGDEVQVPGLDQEFHPLQQIVEPRDAGDWLRKSEQESIEMNRAEDARWWNLAASIAELRATTMAMMPSVSTQAAPFGVGVTISSANWGQSALVASGICRIFSQIATEDSSAASRTGRLVQQLQERRLQANMAGHEIKVIDRQIEVSKIRVDIMRKDLEAQKKRISQTQDVLEFHLKKKHTNGELYTWLDNALRAHLYQVYTLAVDLAHKAQKAYQFESGRYNASFIPPAGFWDHSRDGLLSGESLYLALKRLEMAHMEKRYSDFEIVKNVSLRQLQPLELLQLRETGTATFSLPEALFDLDFPGHYNRRLKSVSVSIPCVTGPYGSPSCILRLQRHRYRTSADLTSGYAEQPLNDGRFYTSNVPIKSIAISTGQSDSGTFELNFHDERYLPFEGAGAISEWTLEFPGKYSQFDRRTISDVVLHVRYTAQNGSEALAKMATAEIERGLQATSTGVSRLLDLPNDYPAEWIHSQFSAGAVSSKKTLVLTHIRDRLPFYLRSSPTKISKVWFLCPAPASASPAPLAGLSLMLNGRSLELDTKKSSEYGMSCLRGEDLALSADEEWQVVLTTVQSATATTQGRISTQAQAVVSLPKIERAFIVFQCGLF